MKHSLHAPPTMSARKMDYVPVQLSIADPGRAASPEVDADGSQSVSDSGI